MIKKSESVCFRGLLTLKEHNGTFLGVGKVLDLDSGVGYNGIYTFVKTYLIAFLRFI